MVRTVSGALISLGSVSSKWTLKAMKKYFDEVHDLSLKKIEVNLGIKEHVILYDGQPMKHYDGFYIKGSFRYNPLLRAIASAVEGVAYTPISANAYTIGHDKLLTHLKLNQHKIPMPKTYISSSASAAKKLLEKINYPIIMKFPEGTQGKGVMYAESYAAASSMLDALSALKQPFLIQEYIETGSTDIRAIVVGDKVVASMKRKAVAGEKRANIHAGGIGEACELDSYSKKIAVNTARAIGAEICAVDMLEGIKGPLVIEVNLSPGLQGITKATKIDVADKIARYLYKRTKEFVERGKESGTEKILSDVGIEKTDKASRSIITSLDFRGNRILLPEVVTALSKFSEKDNVIIETEKGRIKITHSGIPPS